MSTAVALRNVVRVTKHGFLVAVIPLQRRLDDDAVACRREMKYLRLDRRLVAVQMLDESPDAAGVFEDVVALVALVAQVNSHARI